MTALTTRRGSVRRGSGNIGFKAGNLYVNIHSAGHKGGEIRTQLKP